MGKPVWLKTSFLKTKLYELFLVDYKMKAHKNEKFNSEKLLVVVGGGLGDTLVFIPLIRTLLKHYGKDNVLIGTEDKWVKHYEFLGIQVIEYTYSNNLVQRLKKNREFLKKSNAFKASKILFLGAYKDFSRYIVCSEAITGGAVRNEGIDARTHYVSEPFKVLELLQTFSDILLKEKSEKISFDIEWPEYDEQFNDHIVVSIGSAGRHKMMAIETIVPIINYLGENFPNKKLVLMGSGEVQFEYVTEVLKRVSCSNVENGVNQTQILETFKIINSAFLFIGMDSALYNAAALFGKPTIGLFAYDTQPFEHNLENVYKVKGCGNSKVKSKFGTDVLNSITVKQISKIITEINNSNIFAL